MPSENGAPDPASVICRSESKFTQWAKSIHLDQGLHQDLPDELQGLLEASRKLPVWLGDPDADQFKPYRKIFATEIRDLQRGLARRATDVGEQTGAETAEHLPLSLWPILRIPQRHCDLAETVQICGQSNEAEMRTAVDELLNYVWCDRGVPNFAHLLERKLQLPESHSEGAICVTETIPDSIVLFWHPAREFLTDFVRMPLQAPTFSCLAREHTRAVLHWATEYKQDDALAASRQIRMAMVSGLYQRRALGFIDHFVFGTAHSGNHLEVFAGRWELVESPANQETGASHAEKDAPTKAQATQNQKDRGTTPPEARRSTLRSSNKPPGGSTSNLTKRDKYEIKIYQFPGYFLSLSLDMIEFYMLMRASRDLASYLWKIVLGRESHEVPNKKGRHLETIEEGRRVRADFLPEQDDGMDEWEVDDEGRLHLVNGGRSDWPDSDQIVQAYLSGLARDKPADPVVENTGYM